MAGMESDLEFMLSHFQGYHVVQIPADIFPCHISLSRPRKPQMANRTRIGASDIYRRWVNDRFVPGASIDTPPHFDISGELVDQRDGALINIKEMSTGPEHIGSGLGCGKSEGRTEAVHIVYVRRRKVETATAT